MNVFFIKNIKMTLEFLIFLNNDLFNFRNSEK